MARHMGIDVGTDRIGLAFSDVDGRVATAHSTVEVESTREAAAEIAETAEGRDVEVVVVGWPVRMDGTEGRATEMVKRFLTAFEEACRERGWEVPVERWDERLSSSEAESVLIDADMSRRSRRGIVDRVAAARILQNYLDAQDDTN